MNKKGPITLLHMGAITEYTQSGNGHLHSIMMEKLAQPGEVRGPSLPPFTIFTITDKAAVYPPAERADKLPLFHLYPYVLCGCHQFHQLLDERFCVLLGGRITEAEVKSREKGRAVARTGF